MTIQEIEELFLLHPNKMNKGAKRLAERFEVTVEDMYKIKERVKESLCNNTVAGLSNIIQEQEEFIGELLTKVNNDKGTLESTIESKFEPKSDIELAELHKIDLTKYKISNYWSKLKSNGKFTSSVLATLRKVEDMSGEDIINTLKKYKSEYVPLSKFDILVNNAFVKPTCAFIDITDFHLDKRDIKETTIEQKTEEYYQLLNGLLYKAYQANYLEEIAFVIGSDMLHTDTFFNTTTKNTLQETTVRWNEAFDIAFDIYVTSINKLKQFCNTLNVILVAGNHGRTKEYYLAFALKKYFESEKSIVFDISVSPRKVFTYGNTFIGLHHGNTKAETLPLIFAKEFTKEWGNAKYHNIVVGDKHHFMEKDYQGVRVKQLPCVSKPDTWHNDSNYVNSEQSAICIIYDKEKGSCMTIEEKL
jgi:hypothetical protein